MSLSIRQVDRFVEGVIRLLTVFPDAKNISHRPEDMEIVFDKGPYRLLLQLGPKTRILVLDARGRGHHPNPLKDDEDTASYYTDRYLGKVRANDGTRHYPEELQAYERAQAAKHGS